MDAEQITAVQADDDDALEEALARKEEEATQRYSGGFKIFNGLFEELTSNEVGSTKRGHSHD